MSRVLLVVVLAAAAGCGDTQVDNSAVRTFDRPIDLAFGCYGRLRLVGDNGLADADDEVRFSAQPLSSCVTRKAGVSPANAPPGQQDLEGGDLLSSTMSWIEVAVQPTSGTITTLVQAERGSATPAVPLTLRDFEIADGDPLTPGHNSLAVGSLPLAIATDTAGCHALTANAGSCDLSVINLDLLVKASTSSEPVPLVRALPVIGGGTPTRLPLLARPAAIVSADLQSPIGVACPAQPEGVVYVAYPDCHAVAAIDAGTGEVVASIRFDDDGTPTIDPTGDLICPRQCGDDREATTDSAGRPVTLDLVRDAPGVDRGPDFQRLAIGLDNRPVITVIDLGPDGLPLPLSLRTIELEGDIGVIDIALSKQIKMGGDNIGLEQGNNDFDDASGVEAEFVYAVATDATVRVAEVLVAMQECDTQVDARLLFAERDVARLVCMGVGQPGTPRRRAGARSPGIEFPGQARPLAVTIASVDNALARSAAAVPSTLAGHFGFVALSNGFTAVVNVDDDNYPDTYRTGLPLGSVVALGMPHQVRDAVGARDVDNLSDQGVRTCKPALPINGDGAPLGGPHAQDRPTRVAVQSEIAETKAYTLPYGHQSLCTGADATVPVGDLTFAAPTDVRDRVFPDWRGTFDENWVFTWEGALSTDGPDLLVDGPAVHSGLVDIAGGGIRLVDAGHPFCAAGVEPYDMVTLRGCDPARGDAQCGPEKTCFVHPSSTVATGACLPTDRLEGLASACRDFLVSQRRYSVSEAFGGELRLHERWRELRTTPVSGCTSTAQCMDLAKVDETLVSSLHPKDEPPPVDPPPAPELTYECLADPSRAPGPNRCVMTCTDDSQCEAGTLCRAGRCLEGIVPAPECAQGLQRYDLRGSDAFVVIGDRTGYLHPVIEDVGSGRCVKDPTASPLLTGRIPLTAPPCTGDEPGDLSPNPCAQPVEQVEEVPNYAPGTCTLQPVGTVLRTRTASSIRFSNPAFRFSLVDPTYPGDALCREDRGGTLVDVPSVYTGFNLRFRLLAGFGVMVAGSRAVQPANVVRSPDGAIWVIDAGDIDDLSAGTPNIFGQLVRIDPTSPTAGLVFQ